LKHFLAKAHLYVENDLNSRIAHDLRSEGFPSCFEVFNRTSPDKESVMSRLVLTLAILFVVNNIFPTKTPPHVRSIPRSEVSGVVNIGGDRMILVADEGYDVQIVSNAAATFKAGDKATFAGNTKPAIPAAVNPKSDASKAIMDDLEDVAWDNQAQAAFIVASHSLTKNSKDKPARHKLARLQFKSEKIESVEVEVLRAALEQKFSFFAEAMKKKPDDGGEAGGFNIEALAFNPRDGAGSLLLGLRSPTSTVNSKPCAIVLTLKNPNALFDAKAAPEFDDQFNCLELGGLGIRGMTYDDERSGFWILAGRSGDPNTEPASGAVVSSLWFWNATKSCQQPRKVEADLAGLVNVEGVSLLKVDAQEGLLLISDDSDASPDSRYLWLPKPAVTSD
jgi:hypothetical protein